MSAEKFEKLIDLIINEDQEAAEALFHQIVVEKSRGIYESLINDDLDEDAVTSLVDEISSEEEGMDGMMGEDEEEESEEIEGDYDVDGSDDDMDVDMDMEFDSEDHHDDMGGNEELEDRVVDLEDKLDQLMAEFEAQMSGDDESFGDEESDEEGDEVMEAVEMKKVSVTHTDGADSSAKKGPVDANSGATGMASKPVNFSGGADEKGRSAPTTKPVSSIKFKNAPDGGMNVGDGKGESAPAPKKEDNKSRSPVPESKRVTKKMVK